LIAAALRESRPRGGFALNEASNQAMELAGLEPATSWVRFPKAELHAGISDDSGISRREVPGFARLSNRVWGYSWAGRGSSLWLSCHRWSGGRIPDVW